jgi:hypothetical protein
MTIILCKILTSELFYHTVHFCFALSVLLCFALPCSARLWSTLYILYIHSKYCILSSAVDPLRPASTSLADHLHFWLARHLRRHRPRPRPRRGDLHTSALNLFTLGIEGTSMLIYDRLWSVAILDVDCICANTQWESMYIYIYVCTCLSAWRSCRAFPFLDRYG